MAIVTILLLCFVEVYARQALSGTKNNQGRSTQWLHLKISEIIRRHRLHYVRPIVTNRVAWSVG